jgi:hypothetical protein
VVELGSRVEGKVTHEKPDHHDAELVLRVYELRREPVMRTSRYAILREFWPAAWDDVKAVTNWDHPLNTAFRQVSTYWEMVYGMVKHGVVHPGYFLESNGEGMYLFAKIEPYLQQYRQESSPRAFQNAEWVATQCPEGRVLMDAIRARVRKMAESR